MTGRLDEALADDLDEMLTAVVNHDPADLTSVILRLGSAPPPRPANDCAPTSPISLPTLWASRSRTWTWAAR